MRKALAYIYCLLSRHNYTVQKHVRGSHPEGSWIVCLRCKRCERRYILSEPHQACFRYDNDPTFRSDILRMYPQVGAEDL